MKRQKTTKSSDNSPRSVFKQALAIAVLVAYFAAWCFHLLLRSDLFCYEYLTIADFWPFVLRSVLIPIIPLVIWILIIVFLHKRRKVGATASIILFVPVLFISVILGAVELLFSPTTCSYTNKVEHFGKYDKNVAIQLSSQTGFPNEIYQGAEDVQYCYYYRSASDELAYICVSWKISNEQEFQDYIQDYVEVPLTEETYNSGWLQKGWAYRSAVLVDDRSNQVTFVVSCCHNIEDMLPSSADDAIRDYREVEGIYLAS